ncbi:MAG: aminodeoxychorismate synthase component I [Hyphomicrobiales bacterium]|nr:aminodeoxychorismate synthase component I [Hyphomicrobiales bacterium]
MLFRDPATVVRCDDPSRIDEAFEEIERGLARGLHAAGLISYELCYALEPRLASLMPPSRKVPLIWFGLFREPDEIAAGALDDAIAALGPPRPITDLREGRGRADHARLVARVLDLVAAGDVYQVNLTFPMRFRHSGEPLSLYGALRAAQPVAHGGFARFDGTSVISVSPELWIETVSSLATTRPMKGTAARGGDQAADAAAKQALEADPKQRAENLMIVDLLRNDLSRVSIPGTVRVPDLFAVETYPTFHALTSTVTARLRPGVGLRDRIAALFPCGSVVGAPKIRAAEIIRMMEPEPRGFYTGALGRISPRGDMKFNVAIRTATISADGEGEYGVGGGIVADSDPNAEYDEALLKAKILRACEM